MPPKDLFIIAQVYRCCQYIILGDGRYKGAAPKRPDRRGQIAAMRQLCCRSCVSCRSKVILRRYKGSSKSKDREAPPQTALREGAGLHSPSHMFLGLALRSPVLFYSEQKSLRFSRTACPSPLKLFNSPSDCFCNLIKERIAQKHLFFSCICHKKTLYERTWHRRLAVDIEP